MFLATDKTGTEQRFDTRDNLFFYLDAENAKCLQLGQKGFFTLQQLNSLGEVVDLSNLRLPYSETLDKLLKDFGKVKESKLQAIRQKDSKDVKKDNAHEETKDDATMAISAPTPQSTKPSKGLVAFGVLQLALLGTVAGLALTSNQALKKELVQTKSDLQHVQQISQQEHSADVFVRYFLPNYYSGEQSNLEEYLAKGIDIDVEDGQVMSVILEKTSMKGKTLSLTYVLLLKTEVGQENIRLTIPVQKEAKAKYGYVVTGLLQKEGFPR